MSKYTTGEIAKLCGVSVRTVQYYDSRKILIPSDTSEGGRRLYSEEDVKRLEIICFLREAGIGINSIGEILSEPEPAEAISVLLEQQELVIREEMEDRQAKLKKIEELKRNMKGTAGFSLDSIRDIAYRMENKKELRKMQIMLVLTGIPLELAEWWSIGLWCVKGIWWPFAICMAAIILYCATVGVYYFKRVEYICPVCHNRFRPCYREAFFASHTPTLRKLTCPGCKKKEYCIEVYRKEERKNG